MPIDAWLIIVSLPDMSGIELHEQLRERYPVARRIGNELASDIDRTARFLSQVKPSRGRINASKHV